MCMIENVTRQHLHVGNLSALQEIDIYELVFEDVLKKSDILAQWEKLQLSASVGECVATTAMCTHYSTELLKLVCEKWITVRAHSFAEGCNSKFNKYFERGTRKTLQKYGTDKSAK